MTALNADRNTAERSDVGRRLYGAASVKLFAGALVMLNAAGFATKGQTALGLVGIGRAEAQVDNSGGAAGDLNVPVHEGVFIFANSAAGDAITTADIGQVAWAVDDATVAKTSGSGTRSPAGFIVGVGAEGVHVRMGSTILRSWLQARKKLVQLRLSTVAAAGTPIYRAISPFSGLVTKIDAIIELALTTGDAVVTNKIAGVAITNGVVTLVQAASAAGSKFSATPTAANYVTAGDELRAEVTGTQAAAAPANLNFYIDAD